MATDQAILATSPLACLRFYCWQPPSLSLGYFQNAAERDTHVASSTLPMVRRATGGGAIVHHHELTYCLVLPVESRFGGAEHLVIRIHKAFMDSLREWGIAASLWDGAMPQSGGSEPFLCFQRRTRQDVVLGSEKVAGSAQRRQRKTALIHGSVLLRTSEHAPELVGIEDITGISINDGDLATAWKEQIAGMFGWNFQKSSLTSEEFELAKQLAKARYLHPGWTERR